MKVPQDVMIKALKDGKVLPYEDELITKLRDLTYRGFPLSIVLFCREFCRGECYSMSMNLSRAMEHFTLVHGDVNFIVLDEKDPNHSWVEKDGFVYDTTDGFRWDKIYIMNYSNPLFEKYMMKILLKTMMTIKEY